MKTQLRIGLILVSTLLLLLPGAYGLTLSLGIADAGAVHWGASRSMPDQRPHLPAKWRHVPNTIPPP